MCNKYQIIPVTLSISRHEIKTVSFNICLALFACDSSCYTKEKMFATFFFILDVFKTHGCVLVTVHNLGW